MNPGPPRSTPTYTRFPYTTLFRSSIRRLPAFQCSRNAGSQCEGTRASSGQGDATTAVQPRSRICFASPIVVFAPGCLSVRSEEHTSELQSLMRISYAVFCLKQKKNKHNNNIRVSITLLETSK